MEQQISGHPLCRDCNRPKLDPIHFDSSGTHWGAAMHWFVNKKESIQENQEIPFHLVHKSLDDRAGGNAESAKVLYLYSSGGSTGIHDYLMSDDSIQTLTAREADEIGWETICPYCQGGRDEAGSCWSTLFAQLRTCMSPFHRK